MPGTPVTDDEKHQYGEFVRQQLAVFLRAAPPVLWHYTTGSALINIIESGELWATQVSCLNDRSELRFAIRLLREALRPHRNKASVDDEILLEKIKEAMSEEAAGTSEWFVACLSEQRDDLSQWRAYTAEEAGYAIGFSSAGLALAGSADQSLLAPVNYDIEKSRSLAKATADATLHFFRSGLAKRRDESPANWADVFLSAWGDIITYLAPMLKDPAFESEREWRIIRRLRPSDTGRMRYLQKRTMMTRHLPLTFPSPSQPHLKLLPVAEILVGPGRHRKNSLISVSDLLRTCDYPADQREVSVSKIPYQAP